MLVRVEVSRPHQVPSQRTMSGLQCVSEKWVQDGRVRVREGCIVLGEHIDGGDSEDIVTLLGPGRSRAYSIEVNGNRMRADFLGRAGYTYMWLEANIMSSSFKWPTSLG